MMLESAHYAGRKMKSDHEFVVRTVGLLLIIGLWRAVPNAAFAAGGSIQFTLSDGDNVTCTAIQNQTSLRNSSRSWNRYPTTEVVLGNSTEDPHGSKRAQQTIALDGKSCPNGTIPVRAPRGDLNASSTFKKRQSDLDTGAPHDYVVTTIEPPPETNAEESGFKGTEVFISVWKPFVESTSEFSLAQLWMEGGLNDTAEVGYQVYKDLYGDDLPRLFVYWTNDDYATTGCYDLACVGFVQVSNTVLLAGSFATVSRVSGQQYEIKLRVFKDNGTGDWWLQLNDEYVGYWPQDLYVELRDSADSIQWGGELVDDEPADGNHHTRTQMGSGQFANQGFDRAAYQRNLQYIDFNSSLMDADYVLSVTDANCYSFEQGTEFSDWGSYFFFGGPGRNANCT